MPFKNFNQTIRIGSLNVGSFVTMFLTFRRFLLRVKHLRRKIIVFGSPQMVKEVVEGTNAGDIAGRKAAEDGIQRAFLEQGSPYGDRGNLQFNREKIRPEHTGRRSGLRAVLGVGVGKDLIGKRQVKIPELIDDVQSLSGNRARFAAVADKTGCEKLLVLRMGIRGINWLHAAPPQKIG